MRSFVCLLGIWMAVVAIYAESVVVNFGTIAPEKVVFEKKKLVLHPKIDRTSPLLEIENEKVENDSVYFLVMEDALVLRKIKYNPIIDQVSIINGDDAVEIVVPKIEFFNMMRKVYKILFIERIM